MLTLSASGEFKERGRASLKPSPRGAATGHYDHQPELRREREVQDAIEMFALYLQSERQTYYPVGEPLGGEPLKTVKGYFGADLIDRVRIVKLENRRVANPLFYDVAREKGYGNLPDLPHQAAVTFLDVIVFNEKFTTRDLFHGLVLAAQAKCMGVNEFASLFVKGFLRARSYFLVPLKAHAFSLDARFAAYPEKSFAVEDEIRSWWKSGRYNY